MKDGAFLFGIVVGLMIFSSILRRTALHAVVAGIFIYASPTAAA